MNFVFLMDPLEAVIMEKDTSFILMFQSHKRGHSIFFVTDGGMTLQNGKVYFHATSVIPQRVKENPFLQKRKLELSEDEVDCLSTPRPDRAGYENFGPSRRLAAFLNGETPSKCERSGIRIGHNYVVYSQRCAGQVERGREN